MKYLVMVAATFVLSVGHSVGQMATSVDVVDVPKKVMIAFNKNGNVENVDWTLEGQQYTASFYDEKELVFLQLCYEIDGKWIKTLKELDEEKLPNSITTSLKGLYKSGYTMLLITEVIYSDKVEYEVDLETTGKITKLLFDKNGKLLAKEETEQELEILEEEDED